MQHSQPRPIDVAAVVAAFARARAGGDQAWLASSLSSSSLSSWGPLDRALRRVVVDADELRFSRPSFATLVLSSMTRSGFTRLAAVNAIDGHDRLAMAALLWRTDDVVWAVRDAAEWRLLSAVDAAAVGELVAVMPVVDVVAGRERGAGSVGVAAARDKVRRLGITASPDHPQEVQRSLRRLWAGGSDDAERLIELAKVAISDGDVDLAMGIARRATVAMRGPLARLFASHPVGALRRLAASLGKGETELLLSLSVDRRPEVRAAARDSLHGMIDLQREYARDVVDDADVDVGPAARLIGALGGLGELGRAEDFGRISRFLHDARSRVQAEAVRAGVGSHASGGLDNYTDLPLDKARSPSWRVGVEAARGLTWLPAVSRPQAAIAALEGEVHPAVFRVIAPHIKPGRWSC